MQQLGTEKLPNTGKIVACIPAFNAAESISRVVAKTREYVDEVIVVNDGSSDETKEKALQAGAKVVSHPINLGYGSAISTCLREGVKAGGDIIITIDADLQHNPEEIPRLVMPISNGRADIVTGSRFVTNNETTILPKYRKFGISLLTGIMNLTAQTSISDGTTGFRAYSNDAARAIGYMPFSHGMGASSQILIEASRSGLRVEEVATNISYSTGVDTSRQNAVWMGLGILTSILQYITIRKPLLLIGMPGLAILFVGVGSLFLLLDIFNETRFIPTGLGMFTIATIVIGLVVLLGSLFLYTLSTVSKEILKGTREMGDVIKTTSVGPKRTAVVHYITIRKPLLLIGMPGLAILFVGVGSLFLLIGIFNETRFIPTGLGMFTIAAIIIGLIFLMTSVILYTVSKLIPEA